MTTFGVGGNARYFADAKTSDDVNKAVSFAQEKTLPVFVLGGGSNVLVSDEGFDGLVLRVLLKNVDWTENEDNTVEVSIGAGVIWDDVVAMSIKRGLWGIENLSYVPGSVGAAPIQNIGCYGQELSDTLIWVDVYDTQTKTTKRFSGDECNFSYRSSVFKESLGRYVVLGIGLLLNQEGAPNLSYDQLKEYLENKKQPADTENIRTALWDIRKGKDMVLGAVQSAGSFFKNPIVRGGVYKELCVKYGDVPYYEANGMVKIPAGWLIDKVCGLKGYRKGPVGVSAKHAVSIVNYGNAKAVDIKKLADFISKSVFEKTNIKLEPEVQYIGF